MNAALALVVEAVGDTLSQQQQQRHLVTSQHTHSHAMHYFTTYRQQLAKLHYCDETKRRATRHIF